MLCTLSLIKYGNIVPLHTGSSLKSILKHYDSMRRKHNDVSLTKHNENFKHIKYGVVTFYVNLKYCTKNHTNKDCSCTKFDIQQIKKCQTSRQLQMGRQMLASSLLLTLSSECDFFQFFAGTVQ
jgi:hypothetical protein